MPLVSASILTTVGLSLITGAVKYYKEGSLEGTVLEVLDGLFGGVLGNICHEGYNHIRQQLESLNVPERNADIERCSRHALLKALITFSEALKQHLPRTTLSVEEQKICWSFLNESQKHMAGQLKLLATLDENNSVLHRNPLTEGDTMAQILAKDQEQERIKTLKSDLSDFALREYTYLPGNLLHQQLLIWLPEGLPNGRHWFVYYIHELHANLKKDEPPYFKNARRILTQKNLADISLLSKRNLATLNRLMTLSEEIRDTVLRVEDRLTQGLAQVNQKLDFLIKNSSPDTFAQYEKDLIRLKELDDEFYDYQQELADLIASFLDDGSEQAERIKQRISRVEKRRSNIDAERQTVRQEVTDIERAALEFVSKLTPESGVGKDSEILREARACIEIGDFAGANKSLSEDRINEMITRAAKLQQGVDAINKQAAQALMAKVDAVTAMRQENWLVNAIGFCEQAVKIYSDYEIVTQAAYFLQEYNQFDNAIILYNQALQIDASSDQRAILYNNLALLLAEYPDQHPLARQHYEEALTLYRGLAKQNPSVYESDVAMTLNNLALLLARYPDQHLLVKQHFEEALTLYRGLAKQNPSAYEPYVARILTNQAIFLARYPDQHLLVRQHYEEALILYRGLAKQNPSAYEPYVAGKLNNLANLLTNYPDQHPLARQYYEEALILYHGLAEQNPSVYELYVADSLNNLALLLAKYPNQHPLARQYYEEALMLYRGLAEQNPSVYEPYVADSLNGQALLLVNYSDQHSLARQYYEEALKVRRKLAEQNPPVYEPYVADSLNNLANLLARYLNQHPLAKQYYQEALRVRRGLAKQNPSVYEPYVADSLNNLALLFAEYPDQHPLARQHYEEALTLYRGLAKQNPSVYESDVADSLNNLALLLAEYPDQHPLARQHFEEALTLYRGLAEQNPIIFLPQQAKTLVRLSHFFTYETPNKERALTLAREANQLVQLLPEGDLLVQIISSCQVIVEHWGEVS